MARITVRPNLSPRIITVDAPDTTISVQELTNLIKGWEDEPPNLSYPILVETSGKEALGGGVLVGITAELQNAVIGFEPRTTSISSGSATSANVEGTILIDTGATFQTDGVSAGDIIINFDDQSLATVLRVDSETRITHYPLADGSANDWSIADGYKIWTEVQCDVSGGNLVSVDGDGNSIDAIFPTAFTNTVIAQSSSATAIETATSGLTATEATTLANILKVLINQLELSNGLSGNMIIYDDDDTTPLYTFDITDVASGSVTIPTGIPTNRSRGT